MWEAAFPQLLPLDTWVGCSMCHAAGSLLNMVSLHCTAKLLGLNHD